MIIGSIHQKDTAILNVYVPNNRATNRVKQKLVELKGELDKSTIVAEDFIPTFSTVDKTTRQNQQGRRRTL